MLHSQDWPVSVYMLVSRVVTRCGLIFTYQNFGGTYFLHFQGCLIQEQCKWILAETVQMVVVIDHGLNDRGSIPVSCRACLSVQTAQHPAQWVPGPIYRGWVGRSMSLTPPSSADVKNARSVRSVVLVTRLLAPDITNCVHVYSCV
jgi:hypothetical protein